MSSFDVGFLRPKKDKVQSSNIKNIQTLFLNITATSTNVTIDSVNKKNSVPRVVSSVGVITDVRMANPIVKIVDETTINIEVNVASSIFIVCEIIEYENVKSLQTFELTGQFSGSTTGNYSLPQSIEKIDLKKSILNFSYNITITQTDYRACFVTGRLSANNEVTFTNLSNYTAKIRAYIVEFY